MKMSQQDKYSILSRESEVDIIRKVILTMNEQKKYDRSDRQPAGLLGTGACQHQNATDALRHASGSEENRAKLGRGRPRTDRRTGCHRDQSGHQQHGQPRITPLDYLT